MELLAAFLFLPEKAYVRGEGQGNNPLIPTGTYPTTTVYIQQLGGAGGKRLERKI